MNSSTELIQSTRLPARLTIIGGGYLGIELAAIYQAFGSQVTVLEAAPRLFGREDDDIAAAAVAILADDGIEIVTGARSTRSATRTAARRSPSPSTTTRASCSTSFSLAAGDEATARLASTVAIFLEEGSSFLRAGRRLGIHANTVAHRVRRAESMLGRPVTERQLELRVALRLAGLLASPRRTG